MNKQDAIEVLELFKENYDLSDDDIGSFLIDDYVYLNIIPDDENYDAKRERILAELKDTLKFEFVHQEGGGEGGTEWCHVVFKIHDKLYRVDYSYYSYDGYRWDDVLESSNWREVQPVPRTVIFYE